MGVVVAASRIRHPLDARTLARLAVRYAGDGPGTVVGFGLSNDERRGSLPDFAPAFEIARHGGLALVPHGGELLGPASVVDTLTVFRPDRVGHGVRASEDPAALDRRGRVGRDPRGLPGQQRRARGLRRPGRRSRCGPSSTPGIPVALGADDPLLFGTRLAAQYALARDELGFSDAELAALARQSIEGSRAPEAPSGRPRSADVDAWLAG